MKKADLFKNVAIICFAFVPSLSFADSVSDVNSGEVVIVTATRTPRPIDKVPVSVSVITKDDIKNVNVDKIQDLLKNIESVDIGQQFSVAHSAGVNIRGVGGSFVGNTTQLMLDGMATDTIISNVMGRGGLNFMSPWDVDRIEVARGPGSASYGPGVIGGMVNIVPKRWTEGDLAELHASYGTHNTQKYGVAIGTANETFDVRASYYDASSDGFISQTIAAFGQVDLGPRDWKDKKASLSSHFRPAEGHEFTASVQTFKTDSLSVGGRPFYTQDFKGNAYTLGYKYTPSDKIKIDSNVRYVKNDQAIAYDELVGSQYVSSGDTYGRYSDSLTASISAELNFITNNSLLLGYEYGDGKQDVKSLTSDVMTVTTSKARTNSAFIQDEYTFGKLVLLAGVRFDGIKMYGDAINGVPKAGVKDSKDDVYNYRFGARYQADEATSFYISYGTAYLPAYNTPYKYVAPSNTRIDNPDLKPEKSKSFEIGMSHNSAFGRIHVAAYSTDYKDKIALISGVLNGKSQWQNFGAVHVNGLELGYEGKIGETFHPYANYSYTQSEIVKDTNALNVGQRLTYTAPQKFNAGFMWEVLDGLSWTVNGRYIGDKYLSTPNIDSFEKHLNAYSTYDTKISYRLPETYGAKAEIYLAVNNLTDKIYREYQYYEYSDGRTFTFGIDTKF